MQKPWLKGVYHSPGILDELEVFLTSSGTVCTACELAQMNFKIGHQECRKQESTANTTQWHHFSRYSRYLRSLPVVELRDKAVNPPPKMWNSLVLPAFFRRDTCTFLVTCGQLWLKQSRFTAKDIPILSVHQYS